MTVKVDSDKIRSNDDKVNFGRLIKNIKRDRFLFNSSHMHVYTPLQLTNYSRL